MMKKSVIAMAPVMAVMLGGFNCPLVTAQTEPIIAETPEYTVQEGDSLWKIVANQYPDFDNGEILNRVNAIADLNGLADVNEIFEGQVLRFDNATDVAPALQLAEAAAGPAAAPVLPPAASTVLFTEDGMPALAEDDYGRCNTTYHPDFITLQCVFSDTMPLHQNPSISCPGDYDTQVKVYFNNLEGFDSWSADKNTGVAAAVADNFKIYDQGDVTRLSGQLDHAVCDAAGIVYIDSTDSSARVALEFKPLLLPPEDYKPWALAESEFPVTLLPEVNDENCKTESVEKWVEENNLSKEEMSEFTEKCVGRGDFKRSGKRVLIP